MGNGVSASVEQVGVDPQFGRLITQRGTSALYWVLAVVFAGLAALGGLLVFGGLKIRFFAPGRQAIDPQWAAMVGVGATVVLVFGGLAYITIREMRTKHRFYEGGVRVVLGGKVRRAMAYADCERFWYTVTRQYINGIYAGTALNMTLKAKGKPTIKWTGRHKEKPRGLSFTVLGKGEFKGEDELDVVKLVLADAMADAWIDRMTAGEGVNWCGRLELHLEHVRVLKGKRKGQAIPYEKIDRFGAHAGTFGLFHEGDDKPFVNIGIGETNFWPGIRAFERMREVADGDVYPGSDSNPDVHPDADSSMPA